MIKKVLKQIYFGGKLFSSIHMNFLGEKKQIVFGKRGIVPKRNCTHLLKHILNLFVCIKLNFFLTIFLSLSDLFP